MRRSFTLTLMLPLMLASCGGAPAQHASATLALTIIGGTTQNPDATGTAEPVAVRIFPLASTGAFTTTDPYSLMSHATALLGTGLAGPPDQVIVSPGATVHVDRHLPDGAQALGIAVLFRSIDQAQWRQVAPLSSHKPNVLTLRIQGLTAKLTPDINKG